MRIENRSLFYTIMGTTIGFIGGINAARISQMYWASDDRTTATAQEPAPCIGVLHTYGCGTYEVSEVVSTSHGSIVVRTTSGEEITTNHGTLKVYAKGATNEAPQ